MGFLSWKEEAPAYITTAAFKHLVTLSCRDGKDEINRKNGRGQ